MNSASPERIAEFRDRVRDQLQSWQQSGIPSRQRLVDQASRILALRDAMAIPGLWHNPPLMLAATLDDGFGHGLEIIRLWAEAVGMQVHFAGLLLNPSQILEACRRLQPDLLGVTVLQFDTAESVQRIAESLPPGTRLIAGGCQVADFLEYVLDFGFDA